MSNNRHGLHHHTEQMEHAAMHGHGPSDTAVADPHAGHGTHGGHMDHVAMFRDRFWLTVVLALLVVAYSEMFQRLLGYTAPMFPGSPWVSPILGTVIFLYGGWPFLTGAISELRQRQPGMMLLIGLAITVAFAASWATEVGAVALDFWWELASLIAVMLLGHWLEMRAVGQASGALEALTALLPDEAERINDGRVESVSLEELRPGDIVLVRPGARVPSDGEIVEGTADLDESMITGESRPVTKSVGDTVVAGTVATDSAIRVRVSAVGEETALAGIRRLVEQAQQSKSRAQALADRAAAVLFYVASSTGVITYIVWSLLGQQKGAPGLGRCHPGPRCGGHLDERLDHRGGLNAQPLRGLRLGFDAADRDQTDVSRKTDVSHGHGAFFPGQAPSTRRPSSRWPRD